MNVKWRFFARHPNLWKGERCLALGSEALSAEEARTKCAQLAYCYEGSTDARIEVAGDAAGVIAKKRN